MKFINTQFIKDEKILEKFFFNGVYLFGTGNFGKVIKNILKIKNIPLKGFIDTNKKNIGTQIQGIKVF